MIEKIVKKAHIKLVTSLSGILSILTMILPLVFVVAGIFIQVNGGTENNPYMGYMWILLGVFCFAFSFKRFKEFLILFKYIFKPATYDFIVNLVNEGVDLSKYDEELTKEDIINKLNKNNPIIFTDSFIIGFTNYSFFILLKKDIVWAYEYNGNGIVFMDKNKTYGFTFFPQVDRNDEIMEMLKHDMPYIYLGIDFDYKTVMHDDFQNTLIRINEEKMKFESDPDQYRIDKAEEERKKIEEESKALEEAKEADIKRIEAEDENALDNEEMK